MATGRIQLSKNKKTPKKGATSTSKKIGRIQLSRTKKPEKKIDK